MLVVTVEFQMHLHGVLMAIHRNCAYSYLAVYSVCTSKNDLIISTFVTIILSYYTYFNRFFANSKVRTVHVIITTFFAFNSDTNISKQM